MADERLKTGTTIEAGSTFPKAPKRREKSGCAVTIPEEACQTPAR
jgi:hypothetical protein